MWINAALSFEHSISFNSTKSVRFLQIQHCLGYKLILAVGLELLKNKKKDLGEKDRSSVGAHSKFREGQGMWLLGEWGGVSVGQCIEVRQKHT